MTAELVACQRCGMPDPPPDQTCDGGIDHFVGTGTGCGNCGRLVIACVKRPCSALREQSYETGWDDGSEEGSG